MYGPIITSIQTVHKFEKPEKIYLLRWDTRELIMLVDNDK